MLLGDALDHWAQLIKPIYVIRLSSSCERSGLSAFFAVMALIEKIFVLVWDRISYIRLVMSTPAREESARWS